MRAHENILADCLRLLDQGASLEDVLARYPGRGPDLLPILKLHGRLLEADAPEVSFAAYQAGRRALLASVGQSRVPRAATAVPAPSLLQRIGGALRSRPMPAAVAVGLVVLGGSALGVSVATGVGTARDVVSALPVIDLPANDNANEGPGNADDGIGNAPPMADPGRQQADDAASGGIANAPDAGPQAGCPIVLPPQTQSECGPSEADAPGGAPPDVPFGPPTDIPSDTGAPLGPELPADNDPPVDPGHPQDIPRAPEQRGSQPAPPTPPAAEDQPPGDAPRP